jgi:two-component system, NtrC family, sensor histidine kinase PilS
MLTLLEPVMIAFLGGVVGGIVIAMYMPIFDLISKLTLRAAERHPWLIDVQLAADAVLVSAFILITGGVTSLFSSLYLLPIIAAATIRFRRGATQVAVLSAVLYLGLVSVQYLDPTLLPARLMVAVELPSVRFAQYAVGINLFGFMAVALLAGSLGEGLRSAGARLERASHQIADLRAFNAHVVDSLLSGLVTADAAGRVLTFNRAASNITGLVAADAAGRDLGDVLQIPPHVRASLGTLGEGGGSLRFDLRYRRAGGSVIDVGFTAAVATFPDGRTGLLVTFQDTTDVRRLEREARMQQRLAAVGEMAAGIAHEIRNPLASMSGSIQVLRQELPLTEDQAQLMDIVLRESERLNETIRSFLAYARPQRMALARLDLTVLVHDAARLLRNSVEVREHHAIEVDVPDAPVWYEADENQVRQILWNLATNGLKAMPGGGRLRLSAALDLQDGRPVAALAVEDQGCGIPPEEFDRLFQPFRSSFEKGTGLGLAIVHRIVTDYQGQVRVTSAPGEGTTVRVLLPVRDTAGTAGAGQHAAGAPTSGCPT